MGETFQSVMDRVAEDSARCRDRSCFMGNFRIDDNGRLAIVTEENSEAYPLSDWAESQLCRWTGIPVAYYKKCPPHLRGKNVEHWVTRDANLGKDMFVRLKNRDIHEKVFDKDGNPKLDKDSNPITKVTGTEDFVRGILSDKYSVFSNEHFTGIVQETLEKHLKDEVTVEKFWLDDLTCHLRVLFPGMKEFVKGKDDAVIGGLHFGNSEVGFRRVTVDLLLWREVCSNGLIGLRGGESWFSQKHLGTSTIDMKNVILNIVKSGTDQLKAMTSELRTLTKEAIPESDLTSAVEIIGEGLSKGFLETVQARIIKDGDLSQYGLLNAFTAEAKNLPIDDRMVVESTVSHRMIRAA